MSAPKKYGLLLPEKSKPQLAFQASRNVFGEDSDSEDEQKKKILPPLNDSGNIKRKTKLAQEKAVMEDPTVYQYDEIYDTMTVEKQQKISKCKEDKKPKYIENLIKTANKRKMENERRVERQVQKEREKEGEEFADKEVFVTSAYKKKLEEMRLEEEKEKYEEYLESIGDVTKQKDLGGFYRHLYEQKLGSEKKEKSKEQEKEKPDNVSSDSVKETIEMATKVQAKARNYRKRKVSNDIKLSEGEIEDSEEEINRCNLEDIRISKKSKQNKDNIDADSDFSIDESSDEESKEVAEEKVDEENHDVKQPNIKLPEEDKEKIAKVEVPSSPEKQKIKVDIWKKRCVGELFDQALKRYYERKAARSG